MTECPNDFHPFIPGTEMLYAIQEAQKLGAQIHFGGLAIEPATLEAINLEKRADAFTLLYNTLFSLDNSHWRSEHQDAYRILATSGGSTFAEGLDYYRISWFVKFFEKLSPHLKRILVDQKDIEYFKILYEKMPGKKVVAVVNQWHTPGIAAHWRRITGTEAKHEPINPIGDMDINELMEKEMVNDSLRRFLGKMKGTEPATWSNYLTQYHKQVMEPERTRHAMPLSHDDDHEIEHSLFNGENAHLSHGHGHGHGHKEVKHEETKKIGKEEKH
jgi:hypothetical protein